MQVSLSAMFLFKAKLLSVHKPYYSKFAPHLWTTLVRFPGPKEAAELLAPCTAELKALRRLQRGTDNAKLSPAEIAAKTKQLLGAIGRTVDASVEQRHAASSGRGREAEGGGGQAGAPAAATSAGEVLRGQLWDQVSRVTDCTMAGARLQMIYAKIKSSAGMSAGARPPQ